MGGFATQRNAPRDRCVHQSRNARRVGTDNGRRQDGELTQKTHGIAKENSR